jgi:hypothetical protein
LFVFGLIGLHGMESALESILFVWVIIAMILLAGAVMSIPSGETDQVDIVWLALLAISWPLIFALSAIGILLTLAANLVRSR